MNKELEKQLAVVFEQDYPGYEFFVEHVINRIFTEDDAYEALPVPEHYLTDENRQKANESGILRIDKVGTIDTEEPIEVFDVTLSDRKELQYNRVGIQQFIRSSLFPFTNAFMLFHNETPKDKDWRFSFAYKESTIKGMTSAKRYTYLFGKNHRARTASERFALLADMEKSTENLREAFSIEALTQEFYNKLYNWYLWAKDKRTGVTFPNNISIQSDDRDKLEVKMIRLITRMLFVWFIKQKQLVPDNLFDKDLLSNVLRDFNPDASDNGNYYNAILQNLFFATLNQERAERGFVRPSYHGRSESYSIKNLYRDNKRQSWFSFPENEKEERVKALFDDIPYLNGGLFECLDKFKLNEEDKLVADTYYDGFSTKDTRLHGNLQYRAFIPNKLFFASEHNEEVTVKESTESTSEETQTVAVMGLLELFKQYNFTVEENATSDKEVSLDPELLGHVFENLLAEYNPETQESARKATGSFYTPREIVEYMVEESLIAYLSGECGNNVDEMRHLVKDDEIPTITDSDKVISDLKKIKILDPACGSGAFPMGILLKITDIIERLTPQEQFNRYETKLEIIKNCIYGIDIQAIAMLICKLRFFISLICDCDKDETKENFGIVPLPNLETKFVAANSLLSAKVKEYDNDWTQDEHLKQLQKELLELRLEIFDLRTHRSKRNNKLADRSKCREIEEYIKQNATKADEQKIIQLRNAIAQYEAELPKYAEDYWVDETVAQQSLFDDGEKTIFRHNPNKEKREKLQALIKNAKTEIQKEQNKSTLPDFVKAVEEVTHWDPYNQNAISPFFDAEWMFGIENGFDVVIGNPPYMRIQGIRKTDTLFADYLVKNYKSATGSFDLYVAFVEKGHSLLNNKGVLNFIMPVKWTNSAFGEGLRRYLLDNKFLPIIINFGAYQVFTASTYTGVQMFRHSDNVKYIELDKDIYDKNELSNFLRGISLTNYVSSNPSNPAPWTLANNKIYSILNKIKQNPLTLGDVFDKIFQGIATSKDDVYFLYDCVAKGCEIVEGFSKYLQRRVQIERGLVKPLLKGEDVHRYEHIKSNRFVIFPYKIQQGKAELYTESDLAQMFPLGYSYIKECESELRGREKGRFNIDRVWFQYSRKQGLLFGGIPKLVAPEISLGGNFSYDINGQFYSTTTVYGYIKKKDNSLSYETLLAILNSQLCWWYLVHTGTVLANGYYRYKPAYLKPLPIPNITNNMDNMMRDKVNKAIQNTEKQIIEKEINEMIYSWYNLTEDEIIEVQNV